MSSDPQDLQSILNTLAAFSQPEISQNQQQGYNSLLQVNGASAQESQFKESISTSPTAQYFYSDNRLITSDYEHSRSATRIQQSAVERSYSKHRNQPQKPPPPASRSSITDPANIIDWPAGLRHVTKLAAQNEMLASSIQKMIKNQNDHERQWWAGREAVILRQKEAKDETKKIDDVLKSIGGQVSKGSNMHDDAAELKRYEMKIYKASKAMFEDMDRELKNLGVPFFGVNSSLIVDEHELKGEQKSSESSSATITSAQLMKYRKKMLKHLEDLYKD